MIKQVQYYFCYPGKVNESISLLCDIGKSEIPHFNPSYLKEMLTLISLHNRKDQGNSVLKAKYLNQLIPGYQNYVRFLMDLGIIQRSGKYIPGETSYQYCFTPEYKDRLVYRTVTDQYLIRRLINKHLRRHNTRKIPMQGKLLHQMTINPDALNFIEHLEDNKHDAALCSYLKIKQGDIFYIIDKTSGRFHSNLTNLPEPLRKYIRVNNKELANIDIKNSQPYLSTILLTDPGKVARFAKNRKLRMLLDSLYSIDSMDVKMFVYLTIKGKLYEYLMDNGFANNRKEVKRQLFIIMFGPGSYWSKQHEIFYNYFPEVFERFSIIKGKSKGNKFESYKRLAILLQTVESYLVLDVILNRIYIEKPGTIALTIHDSVLTSILTSDVDSVAKIMNEVLTGFVGYAPTLKIEKSENKTAQIDFDRELGVIEESIKENTITVLGSL